MTDKLSIEDADHYTKRAEEYRKRSEEYESLRKRLDKADSHYWGQHTGTDYEKEHQTERLLLDICEFLLDNVEYRKLV